MKKEKQKVLWFCRFTNYDLQQRLQPLKQVREAAPWISKMIPLFEDDDDVELHVVSEHRWINGYKHFTVRGVTFHFYNNGIPFVGRHWPRFFRFDRWTDYYFQKKSFAKIVKKVSPHIIHMHGAENEFCTAITQVYGKYPVFITVQADLRKMKNLSKHRLLKVKKEFEIIKMFKHFGYRTETMGKDIKALNPNATLHWHMYPKKIINPVEVEKKFDLVFFARICKEKGIEDLLKAVSIIKNQKNDISLCVIGKGKINQLQLLAQELDIEENVEWAGFQRTQQEAHKLASKAKICVLPTYRDIIAGTIVESLFLKIPVVAYNAGSIHEVNKNDLIISLVTPGDVNGLAKAVLDLLNDKNMQKQRAEAGYKRANEMFNTSDKEIRDDLLKAYCDVIDDFHSHKYVK